MVKFGMAGITASADVELLCSQNSVSAAFGPGVSAMLAVVETHG